MEEREINKLELAVDILQSVTKCRTQNLAKAMQTLTFTISSLLLAFVLATPSYKLISVLNSLPSTTLFLTLLTLFGLFKYTASKSFTYITTISEILGVNVKSREYLECLIATLPLALVSDIFLYNRIGSLSIVLPFIGFSIIKFLTSKDENARMGSLVMLALSMLSSAQKSSAIALTLSISLTLSGILESLLYIEEAERCATEARGQQRGGAEEVIEATNEPD
ncbi:hypothetical protein EYM_06790 [Ignicoccus islandicus DSM 13165]|uniref:Uncharacterized protein n=1 Tax=Ignicoccus islandicus DSM 13165 TaxID=940295 RepID=A0A0U2VFE8_9CREN|nr:hypothetical protein [Ignicoccus islandicus]ALU12722.1 hypothetical protein EYM_06790 [Ignicoccus islandicus DSM 13165]